MTTVPSQVQGTCHICGDPIYLGDPTVYVDDLAVHDSCERSPGPWTGPPKPVEHLTSLLENGFTTAGKLYDAGFGKEKWDALPAAVSSALENVLLAEHELWSLLRDVASEHKVVKR